MPSLTTIDQIIRAKEIIALELPRNLFRGFWEHQTYNYLLENMV